MSSSLSCSIFCTSCEVRKPSKKCTKGRRADSAEAWAMSAMSIASCTEPEADEAEAGRAHGHDVTVIAEDGERVCGDRTSGNVKHRRGQLARHLEHGRDHEQQALRGGEGRGQRPGLQGAVRGRGRTTFTLHFDDRRDHAPDVGPALRRPLIGPFAHIGRRGDRVDGADLVRLVRDVGNGFIAVDGDRLASHFLGPSVKCLGERSALFLRPLLVGRNTIFAP